MEINTKYKPGDTVWTTRNGRAISEVIEKITIWCTMEIDATKTQILYTFRRSYTKGDIIGSMESTAKEEELFTSKEEMLKAL